MALRREIDEFLKCSFEELVEMIVAQRDSMSDLYDSIDRLEQTIEERDDYIRNLIEAV